MAEKMVSAKEIVHRMDIMDQLDPLNAHIPGAVMNELRRVLTYGDLLYPGSEWERKNIAYHLTHALEHLESVKDNPALLDESGSYHVAHAIVRLMFVLAKVLDASLYIRGDGR